MCFELRLKLPSHLEQVHCDVRLYDIELDDLGSVLHDVCCLLEDMCEIEFHVRVCTEEYWPVTVRTDLCVVMEQMEDLLDGLERNQYGRLDFYEQGIERMVLFSKKKEKFEVRCEDMIEKTKSVSKILVTSPNIVLEELCTLVRDFLGTTRSCCPLLADHLWFLEWAERLQQIVSRIGTKIHSSD